MAPEQSVSQPTQTQSVQQPVHSTATVTAMHLPVGVVSTGDARRLRRDMATMQETIQAIRIQTNAPMAKLPRMSRALEEFAGTNRLNFLLPDDRSQADAYLEYVLRKAPVMHMSFASEASRKFTTELVQWLRTNFDPDMLVEIGLEPNMAAGCVVRTSNKVFDFSLSKYLESKRELMMDLILGKTTEPQQVAVATAPGDTPQEAVQA